MPTRVMRIHELELRGYEDGVARLELLVGSGTYVRSVADALGGHCRSLRRTEIGPFGVDEADENTGALARGGAAAARAGYGDEDRPRARPARASAARGRDRHVRRRPPRSPLRPAHDGRLGARTTVITLEPHPRIALGNRVELIATLERRLELLAEAGVAETLVAAFTPEFMRLTPEQFVETYLTAIGAEAVAVGADFRFGHKRAGTVETLVAAGLRVLDVEEVAGVSSTAIRDAVRAGELAARAAMLGRPYELDGVVVAGDQRGGTLGYPTANIAMGPDLLCPRYGIYAGAALDHRAAVSIGTNPHYGGTERRVEPYLLDFDGDLYGRRLVVELWERLRDERVFESEAALVEQIARDVEATRAAARPTLLDSQSSWLTVACRRRTAGAILVVGLAGDHPRREPCLLEEVEPRVLREDADDVVVVHEARRLARLVEDHGVVDVEGRVAGVRIGRPLEVAKRATVCAVVTAMVGARDEGLARAVGYEEATPPGRVWENAVPMQARRSSSDARYITASCTKTTSNVRPSLSVRMSPSTCSQPGLSVRLSESICGETSESVQVNARAGATRCCPHPSRARGASRPREARRGSRRGSERPRPRSRRAPSGGGTSWRGRRRGARRGLSLGVKTTTAAPSVSRSNRVRPAM